MYEQLVAPNLGTVGRYGWCLEYARKVFGAPVVEPTAWRGWENAKHKHANRNLPNVAVPLWFDYWQSGTRYGHVVVYVPNRGYFSSPYNHTSNYAVLGSIQEVERIYGCVYVGWSEDISNVRVARPKGAHDMINDADNEYGRWNKLFMQIRGRNATRAEFRAAAVGQTWLRAMEILSDNPEADRAQEAQNEGQIAIRDKWRTQIHDLQTQVAKLNNDLKGLKADVETLKDQNKLLANENKELKAELAMVGDDTTNLNALGVALNWVLIRLGLKKGDK